MKFCKGCNQEKNKEEFTKNKNFKDGLCRVCKECSARYYQNYKKNQIKKLGEAGFEITLLRRKLSKMAKKNNIRINGINVSKIENLRFPFIDYPDKFLIGPLTHKDFMQKYDLSVEEYLLIRDRVRKGSFNFKYS